MQWKVDFFGLDLFSPGPGQPVYGYGRVKALRSALPGGGGARVADDRPAI